MQLRMSQAQVRRQSIMLCQSENRKLPWRDVQAEPFFLQIVAIPLVIGLMELILQLRFLAGEIRERQRSENVRDRFAFAC